MKKIYIKSAAILLFMVASGYGYAQNTIPANTTAITPLINQDKQPALKAAPGTYEFIKMKMEESFTNERMQEILVQIEEKRHASDTVYFQLSGFTSVKIYPKE